MLPVNKHQNRSFAIDLYRWTLASYVFVFHSWAFQRSWESSTSFEFAKNVIRFGYLSVDIFFILSGYVIIQSAFRQNPKEFMLKRVIRLAPAYIMVSMIELIIIMYNDIDNKIQVNNNLIFEIVKNILPISSKDNELRNFVGWSIAVEMKFYFIILLVLIASKYVGGEKKLLYHFSSIWILLIYISNYFGIEYLKLLVMNDYAPMFIIGLLLGKKVHNRNAKIWIELVLISPFVAAHFQGRLAGIGLEVFGIMIMILLLLTTFILVKSRIKGTRYTSLIGQSSYPFYLICGFFGMNFLDNLSGNFMTSLVITYIICGILAIIINSLSNYIVGKIR